MSCVAEQRRGASHSPSTRPWLKPVLSAADYLALLNRRLQAHPMYLEGMSFPVSSAENTDDDEQPLVVLVRDTRWDHFGVFASVIDEVRQHYELAPAVLAAHPAACAV